MSSSVDSIDSGGQSSPTISSTTAPASFRPTCWIRSQTAWPWSRSISATTCTSSHFGLPDWRARSSCASHSLRISPCASSNASRIFSSGTSLAPHSTIVSASFVPTTSRSSGESTVSCSVGLTVSSRFSFIPMRTAPTGPRNGIGEIISAAETPLMHSRSWPVTMSAESTVAMHWTSLRKPFGQSGRIGRSIMRAVRIARSVGRPSRLKKPPGILPAAYIRSSTSTVSGKKSAPSRDSARPWAVASTIVSPPRTTTAPSACFASLPVSKMISWLPTWTETRARRSVAILIRLSSTLGDEEWELSQRLAGALPQLPPLTDGWELAAQAELLDEGAVALEVVLLQVVQEAAAAADELEQPTARVMVVPVDAQVLRQLVDPPCEQRDLHLRRAGVGRPAAVLRDDLLLGFLGQGHARSFLPVVSRGPARGAKERLRAGPG